MRVSRAQRVLGVSSWSDQDELRRRYHRLARTLHPDAGGDADAFAELQAAYRLLADEPAPEVAASPSWGNGQPSEKTRAAQRAVAERTRASQPASPPADVATIDWDLALPSEPIPLTVDRLAVATLAVDRERPVVLAHSRGPRDRHGPLTQILDDAKTTRLVLDPVPSERGPERAFGVVRLMTQRRQVRSQLLDGALPPGWVARRKSSDDVVATREVLLDPDPRVTALRHAVVAVDALTALDWPLTAWRLLPGARPRPPQPGETGAPKTAGP